MAPMLLSMAGMVPPMLPPLAGPSPGLSIEFAALRESIRWALTLLALASAIPIAAAAGRDLPQLIGAATAGTILEPLAGAFLDGLALLSTVRWAVADALVRARTSLVRP